MAASPKASTSTSSGSSTPSVPVTSGSLAGSWSGTRPVADNTPAALASPGVAAQRIHPTTLVNIPATTRPVTSAVAQHGTLMPASASIAKSSALSNASSSASSTSPRDATGFKIRIPRDLPNIPDAFRKRGAIRSQPLSAPIARYSPVSPVINRPRSVGSEPLYQTKLVMSQRVSVDNGKRTHNDMLSEDSQAPRGYLTLEPRHVLDKKIKAIKPDPDALGPIRTTSTNANYPSIRTNMQDVDAPANPTLTLITKHTKPAEAQSSTSNYTIASNIKQEEMADEPMPLASGRKNQRSRSKSSTPILAPARFPTPTSLGGGAAGEFEDTLLDFVSASMPTILSTPDVMPELSAAGEPTSVPMSYVASPGILTTAAPPPGQPALVASPIGTFTTTASRTGDIASPTGLAEAAIASTTISNTPIRSTGASVTSSEVTVLASPSTPSAPSTVLGQTDSSTKNLIPPRERSSPPSALSTISSTPDPSEPTLTPIELVRYGTTILDRLLSNPVCHNFVSRVPNSVTNYHAVIKKPMDLTTIEYRLWKGFVLHETAAGGPALPAGANHDITSEGYSNLKEFERDLRRIHQNAVYFNGSQTVIHKEALSYYELYTGLLQATHEHRLSPVPQVPQEIYTPSLIQLSEPGPVYLFRAHQVREMDRKMTDASLDLFAAFHQPLLDIMYDSVPLSTEIPRFTRLYSNKNRSMLNRCRDEKNAKVAILSDFQTTKPFVEELETTSKGTTKPGSGVKMVRIKARVMIVKPVGDRHEMVTVGDLDCPSAWMAIACVKAFDLELSITAKLEKGTLSRMRHEIIPFVSGHNVEPQDRQLFLDALGLKPPGYKPPVPTEPDSVAPKAISSSASHRTSAAPAWLSATTTPATRSVLESTFAPVPVSSTTASTSFIPPTIEREDSMHRSEAKRPRLHPTAAVPNAALPVSPLPQLSLQSSPIMTPSPSESTQHLPRLLPELDFTSSSMDTTPVSTQQSPRVSPATFKQEISQDSHTLSPPPLQRVPMTALSVLPAKDNAATMELSNDDVPSASKSSQSSWALSTREQQMLRDVKNVSRTNGVPYVSWSDIEPTLTVDSAHGLFKRIYHIQGDDSLVVQNFKEMDAESFEQRVREVACLLKLRGLEGVGQIQSIIDDEKDHLVGLSMTKYAYTLKAYATSARRHPSPRQKLCLVRDMVAAISVIHAAGLAHRDLSEVNIMVDEDPVVKLEDGTPRPWVRVIDFGKSVFVEPEEVKRWSMKETVSQEELDLLPLVALPPDHGYKLYRSILTLPRTKFDHTPLPPVDPRLEDVYSLGVLIWRTFSGKSPWDGVIEDDLRGIRYIVHSDTQIDFYLKRQVDGKMSRELLGKCLTADPSLRWTAQRLLEWMDQPEVLAELLKEFEELGGGRKRVRKNLEAYKE